MTKMHKINRIILFLIIIAVAVFVTIRLVKHKATPKRIVHTSSGAVVDVVTVKRTRLNLQVTGTGLVKPLVEVGVAPQVSGAVVYVAPNLVQSGFFKKGEVLFKIEDTDSILALEQAKAELAKTELELAQIEGQAEIARNEWQLLNENDSKPHPLVIYEPQLASAKAMVSSARARVTLAELDVQRTTVVAPFNCFIRSKSVDMGQYVRDGAVVLNLVGTDQAEIMVPLSLADIAVVSVAVGAEGLGSPVTVSLDIGGVTHRWQGYIDRFAGEIDAASRMRDVIVVVDDPYILQDKTVHTTPLVLGSFVNVDIAGRVYDNVFEVSRMGLRDDSTVWLARPDATLEIRKVKVLRKNQANVIINAGLHDGDRVILTPLRGASQGMQLRVQEEVQ
ncbi:MAG: efflux RND transporter periplasmic adaptor subunit [Spirochaetales bacterium]|jgi:RND family efflux transporter MFP subunit|nr:efflux RND transporter periplasmic adaptor subunit [Spirochaetales bacterium]